MQNSESSIHDAYNSLPYETHVQNLNSFFFFNKRALEIINQWSILSEKNICSLQHFPPKFQSQFGSLKCNSAIQSEFGLPTRENLRAWN